MEEINADTFDEESQIKQVEEEAEKDDKLEEIVIVKKQKPEKDEATLLEEAIDMLVGMVCLPYLSKLKWTAHHRSLAGTFLKNQKDKILSCSVLNIQAVGQEQTLLRLAVSLSLPIGQSGPVWYFLKNSSTSEKLTTANLAAHLTYGMIYPGDLTSVQNFFESVLQNFFTNNNKPEDDLPANYPVYRGIHSVTPFQFTVNYHHNKLVNISRQIYLLGAELFHQISMAINQPNFFVPQDAVKSNKRSLHEMDNVNTLEELLLHWMEQLHIFLFYLGQSPSPTEKGLLHEIQRIAANAELLRKVLIIMEGVSVSTLLQYLNDQFSSFPFLLIEIRNKIKNFLQNLDSNCVHLMPLESPLERIYVDRVDAILNHVYDVMAILKRLWDNSPQYRDINIMEDYFLRLSWEIVRACQFHLPLEMIFAPVGEDVITDEKGIGGTFAKLISTMGESTTKEGAGRQKESPIDGVIRCCEHWRKCYAELLAFFQSKPPEEQWLPQMDVIFLPVELFAARCQDLRFVWESKNQLSRYNERKECILTIRSASSMEKNGGPEVDLLEEELSQVDIVLKDALKSIGGKSRHVFNLTSKDWLRYFDVFRERIEEIEQRYQCVMISAVQAVENTLQGVEILNVFRPLATRKSLFPVFFIMLDNVLDLLEKNFDRVEKQYVFRSLRVGKQNFSFCEMASWASGIRKKLEQEIAMVRNQPWLPYYPRLDALYHRWSKTSKMLKQVVKTTYLGWIHSLPTNLAVKLRQPIFKWKFDTVQTLEPNFDQILFTELKETKLWKALGFNVPEKIKSIYDDCDSFFELRQRVEECGSKFNVLVKCISSDEAHLFESHFHNMITTFYPGLTSITWNQSKAVINLCKRATQLIEKSEKKVDEYLQKNNMIWNELESLKTLVFYSKNDYVVYSNHAFQEDLLVQREVVVEKVKSVFGSIEDSLSNLGDSLMVRKLPNTEAAFIRYVEKVDKLLLKYLKDILQRSFLAFEGLLMGCRSCPSEHLAPVFEISVSLEGKKIVCVPLIDVIRETVVRIKEVFEISFRGVPCLLRRFALEASKVHDHSQELEDETVNILQTKLTEEFACQTEKLESFLNEWSKFRDLWEVDLDAFFKNYSAKEPNVDAFKMDIAALEFQLDEIKSVPELNNCGIFRINFAALKKQAKEKCRIWINEFLKHLFSQSMQKFQTLKAFVTDTTNLLRNSQTNLKQILKTIGEYKKKMVTLSDNTDLYEKLLKIFGVLNYYKFPISEVEKNEIEQLGEELTTLKDELEKAVVTMNEYQENYRKEYIIKNMEINLKIAKIKWSYTHTLPTRSKHCSKEAVKILRDILQSIENMKEHLLLNEDLKLLDLPLVHFPEVSTYESNIIHLERVWKVHEDWNISWNSWSSISVYDINGVEMQEMLSGYEARLKSLTDTKLFVEKDKTLTKSRKSLCRWEIEDDLLRHTEYCKLLVPLIINFQNSKLKIHHWERIKVLTATNFDEISDNITVGFLQNLNLVMYLNELNCVFAEAAEETKIANSLNNIEVLSNELTLNMKHITAINTYVVKSTSDATDVIKDFTTRLDIISASKHAKYYIDSISINKNALIKMNTFLELIDEFQREWIKWDVFFYSPDVRNFLMTLSSLFDSLNKRWRIITSLINDEPRLRFVSMKDEIFCKLKQLLRALKQLGSLTDSYLLDRSIHYPRFCFLSMDDLVGAISTVYDGETAKPYLKKIFMNVYKIKQQKTPKQSEPEIVGVYSKEGEFLELNPYISIGGEFDVWLSKLDKAIQTTLREDVKQCRNSFKTFGIKVDEVVKVWPLQVCVMSYLLQWSVDFGKLSLKNKINDELNKKLIKKITDTSLRISQLLRENMAKLQREKLKLFFLLVMQIRDQIESLIKSSSSELPNFISFNWDKDLDEILLQIKPYSLAYSWEYQGLWIPTVFTPDLLKSAYFVTTFLVRGYSIGVLGKESSGKTETIKYLSRLCGRNFKSVILTEEMDIPSLSLLLFGVFQTHTWLVFEKAHNIPLDYLPTIGDYIQKVKDGVNFSTAKAFTKSISPTIQFDGLNISLDSRAAVFFEIDLTSSSDFMECAREFCRPVVVTAPSVKIIGECLFALLGLEDSRKYAQKLSNFFKLLLHAYPCEYGGRFGIPIVVSIISYFKKLLNQPTEFDLEDMLPNAVKTIMLPQLKSEYMTVFDDIFETIFSDFEYNLCCKQDLRQAVVDELESIEIYAPSSFIVEIIHLYEIIKSNQKALLIGNPNSGKSLSIKALVSSINKLCNDEASGYKPIICEHLCPQSITKESLFGVKSCLQGYKEQGYIVHLLDKILRSTPCQDIWIVLEGFYSFEWIEEFLNRFQVEYNMFKSRNSQYVEIPPNIKFILIVAGFTDIAVDLKNITTFYFDKNFIRWKSLLLDRLQRKLLGSIYDAIKRLIEQHLAQFLEIFKLSNVSNSIMAIKIDAFLAIVLHFLSMLDINGDEISNLTEHLTPLFIFSVIWSFGSETAWTVSDQLTELVTRMFETLPHECNVLDLAISSSNGQFCRWEEAMKSANQKYILYNSKASFYSYLCNIFISSSSVPILIQGPSGSGKSTVLQLLQRLTEYEDSVTLHYNAVMSPWQLNNFLKTLEMKGDRNDPKKKIIFIDDLECFRNETHIFDTISYFRYVLKHKCLFDEFHNTFHPVNQLFLCCAYQTKLEGKSNCQSDLKVEESLSSTFHLLNLPPFENDTFKELFDSLYKCYFRNLEQDVNSMQNVITEALLYLYFKANPSNAEEKLVLYHPNIIKNFVKGIALCNQEYLDRESFIKVFIYECYRNFYDSGLMELSELSAICNEIVDNYFCMPLDIIPKNQEELVYTRLGNVGYSYVETTIPKIHDVIKSLNECQKDLIIFNSFVRHVVNMTRVIGVHNTFACRAVNGSERKYIGGNILLVGPEGSGKKTCVHFVAQISGWSTLEVHGSVDEESNIKKILEGHIKTGKSTLIIIDSNYLESFENVAYLNNLILESQNSEKEIFNLCMVLLVSRLADVSTLYKYIPVFFRSYSGDTFFPWTEVDLTEISGHILKDLSSNEPCFGDFLAIGKILNFIKNSFSSKTHHSGLTIPCSKFILLVDLVYKYSLNEFKLLKDENHRLTTNIDKFEETDKSVQDLSNQLKKQHSQVTHIQQTCGNTILKMRNIKSEQSRLEQELTKKSSLLTRQKEEALRIRELINRDLNEPRHELESVHKELVRITKEDFEDLKKVLRPTPSVEGIFEIAMILVGYEPSWNEVKKQLSNSLDFISKVRKVSIEDATDEILSQIRSRLTSEKFSEENISSIPPVAYTFLKWINIYLKYARIYKDYFPLKMQADALEKDMEATQSTIKSYQHDLANFSVQHKVLMGQLEEREAILENAEDKMKTLESKIQLAQTVMEQLNRDKLYWEKSVQKSMSEMQNVVGNSILFAGYVTYLGYFKFCERESFIQKWKDKMKEYGIKFSEDLEVLNTIAPLDMRVKWQVNGLKMDRLSLESAALLYESPSTQIVYDPLEVLNEWLQINDDFEFIDIHSKNYGSTLIRGAKEGNWCYIKDDIIRLPYLVKKFLQVSSSQRFKLRDAYLAIGKENYKISKSFKLLIVLNSFEKKIPNELSPFVNFVCIEGDEEVLNQTLSYRLFEKSDKESVETMARHQKELLDKKEQIFALEEQIQELMSHFDEALSEESNLMETLQATCIKASELRTKCNYITDALEVIFNSLSKFKTTAKKLTQLYILLNELYKAECSMVVGFQKFVTLAVEDVHPRKVAHGWGSLLDQNNLLLAAQNIYRFFQQQETGHRLVTAGLLLASWYESNLGLIPKSISQSLYEHESHYDDPTFENPLALWLPDEIWNNAVTLSGHKGFTEILLHMKNYPKLWREWCESEQPENVALPRQMEKMIKGVSRIALIRNLRPDKFLEAASIYVDRILRITQKPANISSTLIGFASGSNFYEPVILKSCLPLPVENMLRKILPVCHPALTSDVNALRIISMGAGQEESIKFTLKECSEKGHWILLKSTAKSESQLYTLNSELQKIRKIKANRRFKLWFYNLSNSNKPSYFFLHSNSVLVNLPTLLKESVEHLYELVGEGRITSYLTDVMKLHLISLAILHVACEVRQDFFFDVNSICQRISEAQWSEVETILRDFTTGAFPDTIKLSNLIMPLYTSGCLNEQSFEIFSRLVDYYLAPKTISVITSCVSALMHYTVPRSCELANHLTQLEFIFKAPACVVTNASQTLFANQQTMFCREVENILQKVLGEIENFDKIYFESRFVTIEKQLEKYSYGDNKLINYYVMREISFLLELKNLALDALRNNDQNEFFNVLNSVINSEVMIKNFKREVMAKTQFLAIKRRVDYITNLDPQSLLTVNLDLGKFHEPLCIWSWFVRKVWLETNSYDVVAVSLTRSDVVDNTLAEGSSEALLENLLLIGAVWEPQLMKLKKEDSPYLTPLLTKISILVTPQTDSIQKLLKNEKVFRTPVFKNLLTHEPIFWINVGVDASLTEDECVFRGVRFLLS